MYVPMYKYKISPLYRRLSLQYYFMVLTIIYKFQSTITRSNTWHITHWLKIKNIGSKSIFDGKTL